MPEIADLPEIIEAALGPEQLIECLLFVADGPVPVSQLAQALDMPLREADAALNALEAGYERRGLRLQRWQDKVQLTTAPSAANAIERFLGLSATTRLSHAALETLAIVAYQQPVTRPQIEAVRGVNSDSVIKSLLSKGLLEEVGRSEGVGRPILYQTTPEFLQHFGLSSLGELPPLNLQEALAQALMVEALAANGADGADGDLLAEGVEAAGEADGVLAEPVVIEATVEPVAVGEAAVVDEAEAKPIATMEEVADPVVIEATVEPVAVGDAAVLAEAEAEPAVIEATVEPVAVAEAAVLAEAEAEPIAPVEEAVEPEPVAEAVEPLLLAEAVEATPVEEVEPAPPVEAEAPEELVVPEAAPEAEPLPEPEAEPLPIEPEPTPVAPEPKPEPPRQSWQGDWAPVEDDKPGENSPNSSS